MHNPDFNPVEFEGFRNEVGLHAMIEERIAEAVLFWYRKTGSRSCHFLAEVAKTMFWIEKITVNDMI